MGESIIHLWVEHIREFLTSYSGTVQSSSVVEGEGESNEGIEDEEGFDYAAIQAQLASQAKIEQMAGMVGYEISDLFWDCGYL